EYAFLTRLRAEQLRDIGPTLSPHSAFLLAQGIETLPFRMKAHVENARAVAEFLEADPRIEFVNWAGLASHPHHERAQHYFPEGPGSVCSLGVKAGASHDSRAVGQKFIESVDLASHLANIGDTKTLVIHPASTTHAQLSEQQLHDAGVLPGLVRISVGIEDVDDIRYYLDRALSIAARGECPHERRRDPPPRVRHLAERSVVLDARERAAREAAALAAHLDRPECEGAARHPATREVGRDRRRLAEPRALLVLR